MSKQDSAYSEYPPPANMQMPSAPPTYDQAVGHGSSNIGFEQNQTQGQGYPQPLYPQMPPPNAPEYGKYPATNPHMGGQQAPPTTVIITQPVASFSPGPRPMNVTCPNCHQAIRTATESDYLCAAHACCLVMFIVGLFLCSCIPYCMSNCQSVSHHCPNCKTDLGTYVPS